MLASRVDLFDNTYTHFGDGVLAAVRQETYGEDIGQNSWLTLAEYDRFIAWLGLLPGQHALEVASGSGGPALYLSSQADCHVTGIDCNERAIATAMLSARHVNTDYCVTFRIADADAPLPFPSKSFDALICIDSMNHFPNRVSVFEEWQRVLRPGRRAVFTDPVVITGPVTNDELALRSSIGLFLFTPPGVNERLIENAGLHLIKKQDVTDNAALVSGRWHQARERHKRALMQLEGEERFAGLQRFFSAVHRLTSDGRLSRIVYLVEKPAS